MVFLFSKFDFLRRPIWFAGMLVRCFHHLVEKKKPLSTSCLLSLDFTGEDEILEFAFPYDVAGKTCVSLFDGPEGVIPDRREPYRRVPLGRVHLDERRLDEVQ